jgi:hypothetical protein
VEEQLNIREWNGLPKLLEGAELCDMRDMFRLSERGLEPLSAAADDLVIVED